MQHEQIEYSALISKYLDCRINPEEKNQLENWIVQSKENTIFVVD